MTFGVRQVCPETNTVIINIGLLLLAFSNLDEERCRYLSSPPLPSYCICQSPLHSRCICRPSTFHSNLQVSWDLNTGVCCTVGVGDLTAVRGQTRWETRAPAFLVLSPRLCTSPNKGALLLLTAGACGVLTGDPVSTRWWSGWFLKAAPATLIAWPMKLYTKVRRLHPKL